MKRARTTERRPSSAKPRHVPPAEPRERDTRPTASLDARTSALSAATETARAALAPSRGHRARATSNPRLPLPRSNVRGPLRHAVHVLPARQRVAVMLRSLFEIAEREKRDGKLTGGV
jgi:hypothetical protein